MDEAIRVLATYDEAGRFIAILLLVVALLGGTWLALRWLTRRWQTGFTGRLGDIQVMLKRIEEAVEAAGRGSQAYSPDDPEPFGPVAGELVQALAGVRQAREQLAGQFLALGQAHLIYPASRLGQLWFGFWPEPRYWWQRCRAAETLWLAAHEPQAQAARAEALLATLRALPLQVARRCQELYAVNDQVNRVCQALYAAGVRGSQLEAAADRLQELEGRLKSLPVYFFQNTGALATPASDKESTILAWRTLADIETPLRQGLEQFLQWQAQHQEAGRRLEAMRQAVQTARQRLAQVPAEIDANSHLVELEQAAVEAEELEARYRSPTLEVLAGLAERILGVTEVAAWLTDQSDSLAEKSGHLQALALSSAALLAQVEAIIAETTRTEKYPLAWTEEEIELARLTSLQTSLGPPEGRRTPAELELHLSIAAGLAAQAQVLKDTAADITTRRDRLVPLLERPELGPEPAWLKQAETLHAEANRYHSKNWPDGDAVPRIRDTARRLAGRREDLVPPQASQALPAGQLDFYLDEVEELLAEVEVFQARLQRIQETLASLRQTETEARQKLTVTLRALEQLLRQWPGAALQLKPVADSQPQIHKLRQEGRKLGAELDKPKSGQVKEKERRITAWVKSCAAALQVLQAGLLAEIKHLADQLDGEIKALQKIALFDRERAMRNARQLQQTTALPHDILIPGGSSQHQVELLVEQISAVLARAETDRQALAALTSQVKDRVLPQMQRLGEIRQKAQAAADALRQNTAEGVWPPVTYDLRPINGPLEQVEAELARLKGSGRTAGDVLACLEANVKRCESVLNKANRDLAAIRAEQSRAQAILEHVDQWQRKLELYRASHYDDADLVRAINDRLNLIAEKRANVRRPQRSARQVEQILDELQQLAYQNLRVQRDSKTETITVSEID